mgnify:CR=1 FL=1
MWGYDAAGTEVNQLAAHQLVLSNQQRYSSILRRGLSSKSREFVQKVLEGMQHDKKARCLFVRAACWICFSAVPVFPLAAVCGNSAEDKPADRPQ